MKTIRQDIASGKQLSGVWCNLGSPHTAEIAAKTGFDWILIDTEHGAGDEAAMLQQINAVKHLPCAPIVRVVANEPHFFKRALDAGAAGIMVPQVRSVAEARQAVAATRYPPNGIRGVSKVNAATCFSMDFEAYRDQTELELVTIIQIETAEALEAVEEIAAIDGVDALFVGPMDLSYGLGIPGDCCHSLFIEAKKRIAAACRAGNKAAGILLASPDQVAPCMAEGFSVLALGSDAQMVVQGMRTTLDTLTGIDADAPPRQAL
jgi:4-hydroxy-2-oxoheptanedioate aldolase